MRLLEVFADIFINAFGITQPTPETRRRASWFILLMSVLVLVVVAGAGYLLYRTLHA